MVSHSPASLFLRFGEVQIVDSSLVVYCAGSATKLIHFPHHFPTASASGMRDCTIPLKAHFPASPLRCFPPIYGIFSSIVSISVSVLHSRTGSLNADG